MFFYQSGDDIGDNSLPVDKDAMGVIAYPELINQIACIINYHREANFELFYKVLHFRHVFIPVDRDNRKFISVSVVGLDKVRKLLTATKSISGPEVNNNRPTF